MRVTSKKYYDEYVKAYKHKFSDINGFEFNSKNIELDYYSKVSAVYSSNIEGNSFDLNSYMNQIILKSKAKNNKEFEEINDLVEAYKFAQKNELNLDNLLKCHEILSKTILIKSKRSKLRQEPVGVFDESGLVYLAVDENNLNKEFQIFIDDTRELLNSKLELSEIFYHASLIHLKFAHLHPFMVGNGRIARILEKWFLSSKIHSKIWLAPTEKYYKENLHEYYQNLNLGVNYYELDYDKCLPFLEMLPNALMMK